MRTFGQIADLWLLDVARTKRPQTLHNYTITVRQVLAWRPELRDRPITRPDILAFRDHRVEAASVSSANRAARALKTCLRWADGEELEHPPVKLHRLLLPVEQREDAALTADETHRVMDAAALDLPCLVILRIAAGTGFRLGEILNLWWRDVDLEASTIAVTEKPHWRPKSRAALRTVKTPDLVGWLGRYKATLPFHGTKDPVAQQNIAEGAPWRYPRSTRVLTRLRAVYKQAGVAGKKLTHSLRHTMACDLASANVPIHAAQKWLGHSSPVITLGIYAKARQADVDAAGETIEAFRRTRGR